MNQTSETPTKRVAFLITTLQVGGAEMQVLRVSRELTRRGWSVRVYVLRGGPGLDADFSEAGIDVKHLPDSPSYRPKLSAVTRLATELRAWRPDCLVTLLFQANVLGKVVGALAGVPVVSSIRNVRFGGGSELGGKVADTLEHLTRPLARATVVNSQIAARKLADRRVVDPATVRVIVNALPDAIPDLVPAEESTLRNEIGLPEVAPPQEFLWLAAGRLEPQKNYPTLLEAFSTLTADFPGAELFIAGEGSQKPSLEADIARLGLSQRVKLLGLRRDLPELFKICDAFVLASRWEGLPNVVLEAMAAGLPTVATDVGGVRDIIQPGETGWLVPRPEALDIASAMGELMRMPADRRSAIASGGQEFVRRTFGLQAVADRWEELIVEAAGRRTRAAR